MKSILIILFLTINSSAVIGQPNNEEFETIDKAGWIMTNFSNPENLTENDIGEVKYLLTLNKKGSVKHIKVLTNTFRKKTESMWRSEVKKAMFSWRKADRKINYKGTLSFKREFCSSSAVDILPN